MTSLTIKRIATLAMTSCVVLAQSALSAGAVNAAQPGATAPLTAKELANAEYLLADAPGGKVKLTNGVFNDIPNHVNVILVNRPRAFGDVNGDGTPDALVHLAANFGGSGAGSYLAVVANMGGKARSIATVLLGDRISPMSFSVDRDGAIKVTFLDRRADEPMVARPTVLVTRKFRWTAGKLLVTASYNTLAGTAWKLASLGGAAASTSITATLEFGLRGALSGNDGCNVIAGKYSAAADLLTFSPLATTLMACQDVVMKQAGEFGKALGAVRRYMIESGQLVLLDGADKQLAAFDQVTDQALQGEWKVTGLNTGDAVVGTAADRGITLKFDLDGKISGSTGCNRYTASYAARGTAITITPAATTRMACEPALMTQEKEFLAALARVARYSLGANGVTLKAANGAALMSLSRGAS